MKTKIAIVASKFNVDITNSLVSCALKELKRQGVRGSAIDVMWVPGAYELPYAAYKLASSKKFSAVITLGCIIKGETSHDQHIATWAAVGIGQASIETGVPILFGVLTPNNERQAKKRAQPGPLNRGKEVADAAIQMIRFNRTTRVYGR